MLDAVMSSGATRRTRPRTTDPAHVTSTYTALSQVVREAGLLRRARLFYLGLFALLCTGVVAAGVGFWLLNDSWFVLLVAAALGILFTQFAFLAHEASHRQVFAGGRANDRAGRILGTAFVGMSYQWWITKHSRHHANPNMVGKDPDIEFDTISFLEQDAAKQKGVMGLFTRRQGYLFFPMLAFEGVNLHYRSIRSLFSPEPVSGRRLELTTIALRLGLYVAVVFWFLPPGMAAAFLGVQLAVFGIYMGASFAPNHVGMPIIPAGSRLDFLSKQVLTSRNIRGGGWMTVFMGGLNYQVEHHLFPNMPRPALAHTRRLVIEHCATVGVPYTETTLGHAYGAVIRNLNAVGLAASDPFRCPMVDQYRRA